MKVAKKHSHLNGDEWLQVHEPELRQEILDCVASVDAEQYKTKVSKEKTKQGKILYSPVELNAEFDRLFRQRGWDSSRYDYYVAHDHEQLDVMV